MYSRYSNNANRPVRLPEHYGGSAFSQSQLPTEPVPVSKRESERPFVRDSIEEKASPVADRLLRAETKEANIIDTPEPPALSEMFEEKTEENEEIKARSPVQSPGQKPSSLPFSFEGLRRLLSGGEGAGDQDKDRLLLLGLILLLSRTEEESDILLWLSLLLLCG